MLGDIVRYNFFTLDNADEETYSLDYAIVLDLDEINGTKKILPITNKFCKNSIESFCIGKIPGFVEIKNEGYVYNKQYVHFNKVIDVDKDEIYPVYVQDTYGNIHLDSKGNPIKAKLDDDQLERIVKKYRIYNIGEEKNLINLLLKSDARFVLDEKSSNLAEIVEVCTSRMDKYREYNTEDKKVVVFFVDGKRYSVVMNLTDNMDLDSRNEDLFRMYKISTESIA